MIQTLPLLPSDWGQWDWSVSNGNATLDQTKLSYQTLLDRGLCSNFSRFVWNDIVDMTANALVDAGIEWDSTYGSASDCKITEFLGVLMAEKFNGVALNINRLGLFYWKWSVQTGIDGYIGRDVVRGVSNYGRKADDIYAWYIVELTKKLNWFLSILKNEANFTEPQTSVYTKTFDPSRLSSVITAPSRAYRTGLSYDLANARLLGVLQQKAFAESISYNNGILLPTNKSVIMLTHDASESDIDAVSRTLYACSLHGSTLTETSKPYATINDMAYVRYLKHTQKSQSITSAIMEANIRDLYGVLNSISCYVGEFTPSPNMIVTANTYARSLSNSILTPAPESLILVHHLSRSLSYTELQDLSSFSLVTNANERTISDSEIALKRIGAFRTTSFGLTNLNSNIDVPISSSIFSNIVGLSEIIANSKTSIAKGIRFSEGIKVYADGAVNTRRSLAALSTQNYNFEIDAIMCAKRIVHGASFLHSNGFYNRPELTPRNATKASGVNVGKSYSDSTIDKGIPELVDTTNGSNSFDYAAVQSMDVEKVSCLDHSVANVEAGVVCKASEKIESTTKSDSYTDGNLSFTNGRTSSTTKVYSFSISVLENGAEPEDDWLDPIRTGNDLYIRSAYLFWQQDKRGYFTTVFYEPVQIGSDLYIRSAHSIWTENDEANIDTEVFYTPVQSNGDLYIRSVDTFWTDGTEGNIDSDVYLSPVQDGSNLYIKQDIFGGEY